MNKLERLLNLTAVLLDTARPLTAEEIRRRVEGYPPPGPAFHRTFERDKDDLRVLGIPLRVDRAPGTDPPIDGYRIDPDDYYLPDPGLDPDELAAVHLASLTVRLEGVGEQQEALWKLGGLIDTGSVVADQSVASLPDDPALTPLFSAIVDGRQVSFDYREQHRTIDPWRLDFQRGRWYVTGFDHLRGEERNFRLDRIASTVEVGGPRVTTPAPRPTSGAPTPAWELGQDAPTTAVVLVDADSVATARRQLGGAEPVAVASNGAATFEVPVVNYDAFLTFLFGFLHRAELLAPADWRADVIDRLQAIEAGV